MFDGTTNEEGKLVLDFKSRHAKYSFNYEVALASLGLQVNTVENVREDQAYFQFKDTLGNLEKVVYLKAKIATVQELITHINAHSKNKFVFFSKSSENILQLDLKFGTLMISKRIAKSLGMLDKKGKISDFFRLLNSQTTIINRSNGNVELDGTNSKQSQNIVQFPKSLQESVWADISKYSFQDDICRFQHGRVQFCGKSINTKHCGDTHGSLRVHLTSRTYEIAISPIVSTPIPSYICAIGIVERCIVNRCQSNS